MILFIFVPCIDVDGKVVDDLKNKLNLQEELTKAHEATLKLHKEIHNQSSM